MKSILVRYAVALVAVGLALAVRLFFAGFSEEVSPYRLFLAAVVVAGLYGGVGPGTLAVAASLGAGDYFFVGSRYDFDMGSPVNRLRAAMFVGEGAFILLLIGRLQSARRRELKAAQRERDLQRDILNIGERERRRIGQDLHDGLGQHLTGIALFSQALAERLRTNRSAEASVAANIVELVNRAVGWTRELAHGLCPMMLDADDLPSELEELAVSSQRLSGIACVCDCPDHVYAGSQEEATHLYRIAQEAVANAIKHAGATEIRIVLEADEQTLRMTISDNGTGISQESSSGGLGLQIMQNRASMIGATLAVGPGGRGGTIVSCTVSRTVTAARDN